jgi:hypothetical protein
MEWYDMSAGIRAQKLALFLDRFYGGTLILPKEDSVRLLSLVDEHAQRLQDKNYISMTNHGLFQVFGLALLCDIAGNRPSCESGAAFAGKMFSRILDQQFTREGVHREHSPSYHAFVLGVIDRLRGGKRFDDPRTTSLLTKAKAVEPWLVRPDGNFVAVGDSEGKGQPLDVTGARGPVIGDFTESGYAVVRDADSMLFVTGMAYNSTHKHADELSFELFDFGRPIIVDTGKYGYRDDPMRAYVTSAAAHNTISLTDRTIPHDSVKYSGSLLTSLERKGEALVVTGQVDRPGLFSQQRSLSYKPGRSLIVRDLLAADRDQTFVSSLHFAHDLSPQLGDNGFRISLADGSRIVGHVEEPDCKLDSHSGEKDPLLGWQSVGYLQMVPATVVRAICTGSNRTITWNIQLEPPASPERLLLR